MSVIFKTNSDILQQQIVNCVNLVCALRQQLEGDLDEGVKFSIQTSLIKASNRLDSILDNDVCWKMPKLDNQDLASHKFEQDTRMLEYGLWTQEVNKQVVMGNLMFAPGFVPPWLTPEEPPIVPTEVESPLPPKPTRNRRKKKK